MRTTNDIFVELSGSPVDYVVQVEGQELVFPDGKIINVPRGSIAVPPNATSYIWVDTDGKVGYSSGLAARPSGFSNEAICVGQVISGNTGITKTRSFPLGVNPNRQSRHWGTYTVANLPTEEDGVKPGDTAWVTDALTLDGTGGLFVYSKDKGWVEIHYKTPATTQNFDVYQSSLYGPTGKFKQYQVLLGSPYLCASAGTVSSPLYSHGAGIDQSPAWYCTVRGDNDSKALIGIYPLITLGNLARYAIAHRLKGLVYYYPLDGITPEESIYYLVAVGNKLYTSNIVAGLIFTVEYEEEQWHYREYVGRCDYDTLQIDATLISDAAVDMASTLTKNYSAEFYAGPYVSNTPSNGVAVVYNGNIYNIDLSGVDNYTDRRACGRIIYCKNVGDNAKKVEYQETPTVIASRA